MSLSARLLRCLAALAAAFFAAAGSAQDVDVRASVDRATPEVNESFVYVLRAQGQVRGEPDVAPLEALFEVLQATTSTRIQIVNGQAEQVAEWIYQLMPRRPGKVVIPPIEVAGRFSNPVEIDVLPADPGSADAPDDIFLEIDAQPTSAYVQSEVVYTVRLYIGVSTGRRTITAPLIQGGEAIVERLGEDRQYQARRGGRDFLVHERRYAIFPQEAGTLIVGPATFEAMVVPARGFSRVQRFRSEPVEIEVEPAVAPPPSHPHAAWLPAQRLELGERWSREPPELAVGVPTTRTLSIEAQGLLETQLPELELAQARGVRQYADRPELDRVSTPDGLLARRIERYAVLPQAAGEAELPGVELPWFNVREGRWEVASLPPRRLIVAAAETPPGRGPLAPAPAAEPLSAAPHVPDTRSGFAVYWPAVSAVLAVGWIATLLLWWRSERAAGARPAAMTGSPGRRPAHRRLLRRLRDACDRGDAPEARGVLLEWAGLRFPETPPRTLGALADRLPPRVAAELRQLEEALYGPRRGAWDGTGLKRALGDIDSAARYARGRDDEVLLPLYR